ncbi:5-formyltetrahydrofolate cyclo-ligase [Halomicrococcus sp. NG-SE-24]|uniref:5-formyltetrahydrofolate cyclo-ligase n=1 Tax=Halomicrococcus sp. NG-SE-24 TaxID=3436928 RepID=UPI003D96F170
MDKQDLRERTWDALEAAGEARFPFPPHGRIPNFAGADDAADRLASLPEWDDADVLKANPDAPQLPVRRRALREGKVVYMAQPRLRDERPFMKLDPAAIRDAAADRDVEPSAALDDAATVSKMDRYADPVGPDELPHVDLVVSGSVAVTETGARVGKGEGYSDLEYAVLRELGAVDDETTVATTVHELQVTDDASPDAHDVPMDLVVTPERVVRTDTAFERPDGVDWTALSDERIDEIPVLARLRD